MKQSIYIGGTAAAMLLVSLFGAQSAQAAITTTLDFGSTGSQVTELQTYYAADSSLYPSGLITGYFGALTQAATQRFQTREGIVSSGDPQTTGYGRVGPRTMARINALMGSGNVQAFFDPAPIMSNQNVQLSNNNVTVSWTTSEPAQGQVYYDTVALRADEATGPRQQPYISGLYSTDNSGQISHSITLHDLKADTLYYYIVRSVDNMGNVSITSQKSFRTNQ